MSKMKIPANEAGIIHLSTINSLHNGLVFITDRGKPAHMLMNFDTYKQLTRQRCNIADALAMEEIAEIDFEPPHMSIEIKPADLL